MAKKNFYGEVEVVARIRLQLDADYDRKPTVHDVLASLRLENYREVADEEVVEFIEVTDIEDLVEIPPEGSIDDPEADEDGEHETDEPEEDEDEDEARARNRIHREEDDLN